MGWNEIVKAANAANAPADGDYIENGLLYCGKCRTPKQTTAKNPFTGEEQVVGCLCSCRQDFIENERKKRVQETNRRYLIKAFGGHEKPLSYVFGETLTNEQRMCQNYCNNFEEFFKSGTGLLLYGPLGTGKTHTACSIANELFRTRGASFIMTSIIELADAALSPGTNGWIWNRMEDDDIVIIDDFGTEGSSDWRREIMYRAINGRIMSGKPMIITTNMSLEDFKNPADYGMKRLTERVIQVCLPIKMDGVNYRRKEVRENYEEKMQKLLDNAETV